LIEPDGKETEGRQSQAILRLLVGVSENRKDFEDELSTKSPICTLIQKSQNVAVYISFNTADAILPKSVQFMADHCYLDIV
jgi:hypothetical protein